MEFFYYCTTCANSKRDASAGAPSHPDQKRWCVKHSRQLPKEVSQEQLICCNFQPQDPRATEWKSAIEKFPEGELWTFELYRPSRKFAVIAELPKVNPGTGDVV